MTKRVVFVALALTHYRQPFHSTVRRLLAERNVTYNVMFSEPKGSAATKNDTVEMDWATKVPTRHFALGKKELFYQKLPSSVGQADLMILGQENKLLHNYPWLLKRRLGFGPRIAFFGHGRNFQGAMESYSEQFKRLYSRMPDWWFCYTNASRDSVISTGFPNDKITVFQNAIDTQGLREQIATLTETEKAEFQRKHGLGAVVGVYIGGMYAEKRLDFLIEAAQEVRRQIPDFQLVFAGDGPERFIIEQAAQERPWVRYIGATFGIEKAKLLSVGQVFLLPGAVGLAVLDAFAAGIPLITTNYPLHGPEAAYIQNGLNGIITSPWTSAPHYAEGIIKILRDKRLQETTSDNARASASQYSIEAMADLFSTGVLKALDVDS